MRNTTVKYIFILLNIGLTLFALSFFYTALTSLPETKKLSSLVPSLYLLVLFSSNAYSHWHYLGKAVSILQIVGTFIIIPVVYVIFAIALPTVGAIIRALDPESTAYSGNMMIYAHVISSFFFIIIAGLGFNFYSHTRIK